MSKDVNKFGTLPFISALYQSAIASRRNEEIESCRRWMLIESTFALIFFFIAFFSTASRNLRRFFIFFWNVAFSCPEKIISNETSNVILSDVFYG